MKIKLAALAIMLAASVAGATDLVQELIVSTNPDRVDAVLQTIESLMVIQGVPVAGQIVSVHRIMLNQTKMLDRFNSQKLTVSNPATVVLEKTTEPRRLHAPLEWEVSASFSEVPLYVLNSAFDLGGYPNNNPPYTPSNPNPPDGAQNVDYSVSLTWVGGDPDAGDIVVYDVYFGTTNPPPQVAAGQAGTSYAANNLTPDVLHYWKIIAKDNWQGVTEGPVWSFRTKINHAPYEPVNPIPPNGATEVDINVNLSWQANDPDSGDTLRYDVYFGTAANPPLVVSDITTIPYDPGTLQTGAHYYWKIVVIDSANAETSGPVWNFTTSSSATNHPPNVPTNPNPGNGATGVWINTDLSWTGGDPDTGDTVVYDVYFGTVNPPTLVSQSYTGTSYDPGTLTPVTMYYWKIVARDDHQAEATGSTWSFTTGNATDPTPTPTPYVEPCTQYKVTVDMGSDYFCAGDEVFLRLNICNPDSAVYLPLWLLLEIEGSFWFAPSWGTDADYYLELIPHDWSVKPIIDPFIWPEAGSYSGARFWAAMTDSQITQIMGDYDMFTFGWGPCR